ncbi:MAG: proton-conducting transporter membrane subunit [Pseudomonadota bacterium]
MPDLLALLPLLAIAVLAAVSLRAIRSPGLRPGRVLHEAEMAMLLAIGFAGAALLTLIGIGPATSPLIGWAGMGLSVRIDILSTVMFALVAFLGWVVTRYSLRYLDGHDRQGAFVGWLGLTVAGVLLMVTAGNLVQLLIGWVGMSLALDKLLTFYPGRRAARLAALKKAIVARTSDAALLTALVMLWVGYGTTDIATILAAAGSGDDFLGLGTAAAMIALAAALKSAQVPLHGWLVEVMETPTPVSALLHAGIVNAGGVLVLRFADVMLLAPGTLVALAFLGGLTALWGSVVMLTQPAAKTALAWSTIAQMGFMMLQVGLALFPIALLHIVAHSLYKAHAFLSAGGAVVRVKAARSIPSVTAAHPVQVLTAMGLAGAVYVVLAAGAGAVFGASPQALGLGAIMALGLMPMLVPALAAPGRQILVIRLAGATAAVALVYLALHGMAKVLAGAMLPAAPTATSGQIAALMCAIGAFAAIAALQATMPFWAEAPLARRLRTHIANGFYAGALFHRAVGGYARRPA